MALRPLGWADTARSHKNRKRSSYPEASGVRWYLLGRRLKSLSAALTVVKAHENTTVVLGIPIPSTDPFFLAIVGVHVLFGLAAVIAGKACLTGSAPAQAVPSREGSGRPVTKAEYAKPLPIKRPQARS
jgi:hypothetical protein